MAEYGAAALVRCEEQPQKRLLVCRDARRGYLSPAAFTQQFRRQAIGGADVTHSVYFADPSQVDSGSTTARTEDDIRRVVAPLERRLVLLHEDDSRGVIDQLKGGL